MNKNEHEPLNGQVQFQYRIEQRQSIYLCLGKKQIIIDHQSSHS